MEEEGGFIRIVDMTTTSVIVILTVQMKRQDEFKEYITAYYVKGEFKFGMEDLPFPTKENIDNYDLVWVKPEKPFENRGILVTHHITRIRKLMHRPTHKYAQAWSKERQEEMKKLIGWNFLEVKT